MKTTIIPAYIWDMLVSNGHDLEVLKDFNKLSSILSRDDVSKYVVANLYPNSMKGDLLKLGKFCGLDGSFSNTTDVDMLWKELEDKHYTDVFSKVYGDSEELCGCLSKAVLVGTDCVGLVVSSKFNITYRDVNYEQLFEVMQTISTPLEITKTEIFEDYLTAISD
jgi:hypothetical protein